MTSRKLIGAAAIAASLAGGAIGGTIFGVPTLSVAQEAPAEAPAEGEDDAPRRRPFHRPGHHVKAHLALDAAAGAIGISVEELRGALADGTTIADVAAQHGVEVGAVVDALVTAASARIDEAVAAGRIDAERAEALKANLAERITQLVERELPGPKDRPGHHRRALPALRTVAEVLGLTGEELRDRLAGGQTIREVAAEEGVDVQQVVDALLAEATERINGLLDREFDRPGRGGPGTAEPEADEASLAA